MNVNPAKPFQLIFSLFQHEYLGFLFESYVVQLNDKGNLTFQRQNISAKNAKEFLIEAESEEFLLIKTMDEMQQETIAAHFTKKKLKTAEFFLKVFDPVTGDKLLQQEIHRYIEKRKTTIMPLLRGKKVFEMGTDGEPAHNPITVLDEVATILFHFRKNEDNTHYFPTIKLYGEKLEFRQPNSYIISNEPAWMMVNYQLFTFSAAINGQKLKPFLQKKFILIPKNVEDTYYEKFVGPLLESFDVYATGFDIKTIRQEPKPVLTLTEVKSVNTTKSLFDNQEASENTSMVLFELGYQYGNFRYKADQLKRVSVSLERQNGYYTFHRVERKTDQELGIIKRLQESGLNLRNSRVTLPESEAFDWINRFHSSLTRDGYVIRQPNNNGKTYFLGESSIQVSIEEKIDWFDIKAVVRFGNYEIPFTTIRRLILQNKSEIQLPNGEIGIIPSSWSDEYRDLLMFSESHEDTTKLEKYHIALVNSLRENNSAQVTMSRKLERLLDYTQIEDQALPADFKGKLRPYQKAGYNWMQFLNEYGFGGCLADDMGLGKTVQALALLQHEKEVNPGTTNLLIMPTSLIYNWEMESARFTPKLKVLIYAGTQRIKDPKNFSKYDLVITSYGIARIDTDLFSSFFFNYIILDESQAIKNPESIIAKAVRQLNSRRKLILTGTPIENSALDLWSQLSFVNPGLLGAKSYFKKEYLIPIEKKQDEQKTQRLNAMIKPFILRRDKSQVATDLPEKTVSIKYCDMSESQRKYYEKEKEYYRNEILEVIQKDGIQKSQMILLQGLTKLRQIANHPVMVDPEYKGDSGKLEDIIHMIHNALTKDHNILIFSQFVKHLKLVEAHLITEKIPYAYLDGSVKDRKEQVEKFQKNVNINIFLISLKAGGVGLNLTKADYVFILDPWWNPAAEAQAIDRAHRIGQTNKVFSYKFITRDTLEEKIVQLQKNKMSLADNLITVEESFIKSLTKEDIQKLFL